MVTSDYDIVIDGELDESWAGAFAPARLTAGGGHTLLRVAAFDPAALHGLLGRIADLGLTLLSVQAIQDNPSGP